MRKSRSTGLRELTRKHGIRRATYINWRQAAEAVVRERGLSIGRACRVTRLSRTAWYRRPRPCIERDRAVIEVLNELVARNAALGLLEVLRQVAA
jgi:hypothetical protein